MENECTAAQIDRGKVIKRGTKALVLLSGGQDSATCLYAVKEEFETVEAVFFHYEQRHHLEYQSAKKICELSQSHLHELSLPAFKEIGGSAMIEDIEIKNGCDGLPNTFVPGRNIVFLTLAASLAYTRNINDIIIGVNETDYSGYPDCRRDFINSISDSISLGLDRTFRIHTPLSQLSKAGIWELSSKLNILDMVVQHTHTCYIGDHEHFHEWGYGCGECPACILRKQGFETFKTKLRM